MFVVATVAKRVPMQKLLDLPCAHLFNDCWYALVAALAKRNKSLVQVLVARYELKMLWTCCSASPPELKWKALQKLPEHISKLTCILTDDNILPPALCAAFGKPGCHKTDIIVTGNSGSCE